MIAPTIQVAGLASILVVSAFSLLAGGRPERAATVASLAAIIVSLRVQAVGSDAVQYGVLAVDMALLAALLMVAIVGKRLWSLWATAFQILAVATHLAFLGASGGRVAYLTMLAVWSYLVVGSIGVGAALHLHRRFVEGRLRN